MAFTLKFGWTKDSLEDMPTPKYEGWKISREKVWNAKAGRSSKALYNGKIVAKKVTLDMAFPANLTPSEIKKLMKYADPDDLSTGTATYSSPMKKEKKKQSSFILETLVLTQ